MAYELVMNAFPNAEVFVGEDAVHGGIFVILTDRNAVNGIYVIASVFSEGQGKFHSWLNGFYDAVERKQILCHDTNGNLIHTYNGHTYRRIK